MTDEKPKIDFLDELAKAGKVIAKVRDRPIQERIETFNQIMGSILDRAGKLPPHLREQLKKKRQ